MDNYTCKYYAAIPKPTSARCELSENFKLSPEQLQFYNEHGYLVVKGLIDFSSLVTLKQRFIDVVNGKVPRTPIMRTIKDPDLVTKKTKPEDYVNKVQEIHYDDVFVQYAVHPHLYRAVVDLIGDDVISINSMFINKPPGTPRHPPHQDLYYFPFRPADRIVAAWTAVDDVTLDNGALYVIPGSHKIKEIYPHGDREISIKLYHGILDEDKYAPESQRVYMELTAGDTLFFHPYLVHGSGPNLTDRYRKVITYHFMHSSAVCIDVPETQRHVAKQLEAESKKQGAELTFNEIWTLKSRPITPLRSKL